MDVPQDTGRKFKLKLDESCLDEAVQQSPGEFFPEGTGDAQPGSAEVEQLDVDTLWTTDGLQGEHTGHTDAVRADSVSYAPSIGKTDFSGDLPYVTDDKEIALVSDYSTDAVVGSAWSSLQTEPPKLPWEDDFWEKFLDPSVSVYSMFDRGFKRPMPFHHDVIAASSGDTEIERRVVSKTFQPVPDFMKLIRDVPEKSWQEERDALWETAIRRWVALIDTWNAPDSLVVRALQDQSTFKEKAQILVDVFFNKAPQTLMKRVNSLSKLCSCLQEQGLSSPCSEADFYLVLKSESQKGAVTTRLKACFEAVVFTRHVLGITALQSLVESRRCLGAASQKGPSNPRQASPFTVVQIRRLHEVLRENQEPWDSAMAGMLLFCIYGRSRWSDAQHAEELTSDVDSSGKLQHLEIRTAVHKTARALHLRHMFLPLSAPACGVTDDAWGAQWLQIRKDLCIEDLKKYPLMPAPDLALEPTRRPVSTQEVKQWILHLLGSDLVGQAKLTSHSCKCTCLSFLAKRGCSIEDRLILGYHSNRMRMALTYSRDASARPLALLSHVLSEIRSGLFEPDNSRSGRLHAGVFPLDKMDFMATGAETTGEPEKQEPEPQKVAEAAESEDGSWQKVTEAVVGEVTEPAAEGHLTTDSSDSSDEGSKWGPVVGHYTITVPSDKQLRLNHNSKMFHLSSIEHNKILLCGRRVGQNFHKHGGLVRYDSAKCRQCFRLKDD